MTLEEMIKTRKSIIDAKKSTEVLFYKLEGQEELIDGFIDNEKKKEIKKEKK